MTATWLPGDARSRIRDVPTGSVDLVLCSPPFLGLREYLPEDHPLKPLEMGLEASPLEFITGLLEMTVEFGRVLAPHGSLVVELGDTSVVRGKRLGTVPSLGRDRHELPRRSCDGPGWPGDKSLAMIPELYRVGLAYGLNPHPDALPVRYPPWKVRNVVAWCRTNPPPGRLSDKFRRAHTDIVVACKSNRRWYDDHEVRISHRDPRIRKEVAGRDAHVRGKGTRVSIPVPEDGPGVPPLDWWIMTSATHQSDHGEHFAAFPEALARIPILSMCPPRVCRLCGAPVRRVTRPNADYAERLGQSIYPKNVGTADRLRRGRRGAHKDIVAVHDHVGWAECSCPEPDRFRPGLVLDPWAGTGTVAAVADQHGRDSLSIELDDRNLAIAAPRLSCPLVLR